MKGICIKIKRTVKQNSDKCNIYNPGHEVNLKYQHYIRVLSKDNI